MRNNYSPPPFHCLARPLAVLLLMALALLRPLGANAQFIVSTLAGSGTAGFTDGVGSAAQFYNPVGVAVDGTGNVYVADQNNNRIRKVSPAGVVSTLAGAGTAGSADGVGSAARFNYPTGVAVDGAGNVYVADYGNSLIRKVTPAGVVTTLAGAVTSGFADGVGSAARFNGAYSVAVDGAGNVYVADQFNNRIRKVSPAGVVSTLAGAGTAGSADGVGSAAQFYNPVGVAVDGAGNVYVADQYNMRIRKVSPAGVVSTLAGVNAIGFADGAGSTAFFNNPTGVAVDGAGNVYVADYGNHRIRKVSPTGVVSTLAGSTQGFADGAGSAAQFRYPFGVAVDGAGNVYVADQNNHRIRKVSPVAPTLTTISPNPAAVGTSVTLTGTNLSGATSVRFGELAAPSGSFSVNAAGTSLNVTVPMLAASNTISVTTPGGVAVSPARFGVTRASTSLAYTNMGRLPLSSPGGGQYLFNAPTVTDLDGDGLLDLLVGNYDGTVLRYEQLSANAVSFAGLGPLQAGGANLAVANNSVPTVTDLDGNGLLDLLVGVGDGFIMRYEQTSPNAATFTSLGALLAGGRALNVSFSAAPTVTDLDGDGLLDLLVGDGNGYLSRYEQPSANAVSFASLGSLQAGGANLAVANKSAPTVTDLDGDGLLDLLVGDGNGYLNRYEQPSANAVSFVVAAFPLAGTLIGAPAKPVATDLDGDGRLELLVGVVSSGVFRLMQAPPIPTLTSLSPTAAPVGTSVTLTGTDLTGATDVSFNGTAATTLAVVNATTLTATVPAGATNGPVTVTTPSGTSNGVVFTVLSAPVLATIEPSPLRYVYGQAPAQITSTLTVSDADSPNLSGATVAISSGLVQGQDNLYFTNQDGITGSYNTGTGVLTLSGTAPVATYQAALRSIQYQSVAVPAPPSDRVIRFTVSDGINTSNAVTRTVQVVVNAPTVVTATPNTVTTTSAVLGGNVTADGGGDVTERGVVYSPTNQAPTASDAKSVNGTGTGLFSATVAGLNPSTTYYVRAYATNSAGTSYGSTVSFTTLVPTTAAPVLTSPANNSTTTGTLTFMGTAPAGSTVTLYLASGGAPQAIGITTAAGSSFSLAPSTALTSGAYAAYATAQNSGENVSSASATTTFTVDATPPTVVSSVRQSPAADPTNAPSLTYRISFSEAVTGVTPGAFALTSTGTATGTVAAVTAVSASVYDVTVSGAGGTGTLRLDVPGPATGLTDLVGNPLAGSYASGQATTLDNTPPTATLTSAAGPSTSTTPIAFTVIFSEVVTGFSAGSLSVTNGSVGSALTSAGNAYSFSVTPAADGPVTVSVAAGAAQDAAGNPNPAAGPLSVTYQAPPTLTSLSPGSGPAGTLVTLTGTHLNGTSAVSFNGTAAAGFTFVDANTLTATVPLGATTGPVSVTTPAGTASSATAFTVTPPVALAVVGTSPSRNALTAAPTTRVALTYNQAVDPATTGGVRVFSHQAGGRQASTASASGNTLTLTPATAFRAGETVLVTSPASVRSTTSGSLAGVPTVYQFTTAVSRSSGTFGGGSNPGVGSAPVSVAAADVDGDGDLDLLTANSLVGTVSVRLNNGLGVFSGTTSVAVGLGSTSVVPADVDGDGDLDLLVANAGSNNVSVRFNNGLGVFSGTGSVAVGLGPVAATAADIDGDGDLDLLVANLLSSSVSIRLNNGLGAFSGTGSIAVGPNTSSLEAADVDSDGDLDLLIANAGSSGTVSVRLNSGSGVFAAGQTVAVGAYAAHVVAADVDTDGDLDLLTADSYANTVSLRFNNGRGTFTGTSSVPVGYRPLSVEAADVDGDGDLDLLVANGVSNSVSVRLNNGLGVFSGTTSVAVGNVPSRVAAADVDGDGDLDLLVANTGSNSVSVRLNQNLSASARGSQVLADDGSDAPAGLTLQLQAFPNPFRTSVRFEFVLGHTDAYSLAIYDVLGRVVASLAHGSAVAGEWHQAEWGAEQAPSGVYLVRLTTAAGTQQVKVIKE